MESYLLSILTVNDFPALIYWQLQTKLYEAADLLFGFQAKGPELLV